MPEVLDKNEPEVQTNDDKKSQLDTLDKTELIEIIKSTRSEAKNYRLTKKELEEKLAQIEKDKSEEIQKKKIEDGKKDEVIAELNKKLSELEPVANEYKQYQSSKKEALKERLGDKWLDSFNNLPIGDLEILAEKFSIPIKLSDTADGNGLSPKNESLTDEEKLIAKNMGLSEDGYIQFKKTREKFKR